MHNQAKIPDSETSARHARNAQAACQQLETFTSALDDLIAQLESEIRQQPNPAAKLAEPAFKKIWDNPKDAEYDTL